MKKNPFSIYDFLGYVFPGALALYCIYFFCHYPDIRSISELFNDIRTAFSEHTFNYGLEETILLTIASYVVGHLVSYLSSLTIEQFAIRMYGYPSEYLFGSCSDISSRNYFGDTINWKSFWRGIVALFLLPLTICSIIAYKVGLNPFFVKPLDSGMKDVIQNKQEVFLSMIGNPEGNRIDDTHRIIYHYYYERHTIHAVKMDNYVALYGFLRSITLILNCCTLYLGWIAIRSINIRLPFDGNIITLIIVVWLTTCIFFMGYMKFNRRNTLESFMCLVSDPYINDYTHYNQAYPMAPNYKSWPFTYTTKVYKDKNNNDKRQ